MEDIILNVTSIEILGVNIQDLDREINCFAIYRRPGSVERSTWRNIIQILKKYKNVLLIGDFNAYNTIWNCNDTDKNGEILQEEMEEEGFFVINRSILSRISEGGSTPSNIDLMFSSEDIFEIISYKQIEDSWGSDHYPIEYKIEINRKRYIKITNKITTKKTDWDVYKGELLKNENILRSRNFQRSCMQDRYKTIVEIIKNSVKTASGNINNREGRLSSVTGAHHNERRNIKQLGNPVTWWDEECRIMIEERKKKLKIYQETLTLVDFVEYKKARAIVIKTIKQKKKNDLKRFATSLNKNTNLKYVWQKMKVLKKGFHTIDWNK